MKKWILRRILPALGVLVLLGVIFFEPLKNGVVEYFLRDYLGDMPSYSHEPGEVLTHRLPMKDGVHLDTRVHLPKGEGPWPTLLVRDPYQFSYYLTCHFYVRFGYACVHQDVRGHGQSEGAWYPLKHEPSDGLETLDWLVEQPFHDGNIATVGASYVGLVQWAVADRFPPEVKTMVAQVSHGDFYRMVYRGGHFTQAIAGLWSAEIFYPLAEKAAMTEKWLQEIMPVRPANSVSPEMYKGAWASYRDYISHAEKDDPYWQQDFYTHLRTVHRRIQVPAFLIARWHDFFLEGTLDVYADMPRRDDSLLMISPGEHAGQTNELEVKASPKSEFSNMLFWLDHHLKGQPLPAPMSNRMLYYLNGADRWETAASWPPAGGKARTLYLDGMASAGQCGGRLAEQLPSAATAPARYVYDPDDPVKTNGGAFLLNPNLAPIAVADQGHGACDRADILSFLSVPFEQDERLAGSIKVTLDVASDAPDTAFTVKLSEVFPDGRVLNIRDDITSLSFRNGATKRLVYEPGDRVRLEFALPPIDWTIGPGSALRLDVSSSNAPAFPPHPNMAGLWSEIATVKIAEQSVFGGTLELPIAAN